MSSKINIPSKEVIISAAKRIEKYIHRTPIHTSELINKKLNAFVFFKCENFQKVGAFKSRGAVNAVFSLSQKDLRKGVCTHSSGNHAAALARAAKLRNAKSYIVMPDNSPLVKINAVKEYGGEIIFCKPNLSSREGTLKQVINQTGAFEIHPYNNDLIIQGQATCAYEFFQEISDLDIIMAPVGGGGLLSGTAISTHHFSPDTKVIAAEPLGASDAYQSFKNKKFIPSVDPNTIADGLLTSLGSKTFPVIMDYVEDIITVEEKSIIEAMRLIWERMKIIVEPSSAVPLATLIEEKFEFENKKIGIILSGGNVDLDSLPWN